jgi:hypothetical protein
VFFAEREKPSRGSGGALLKTKRLYFNEKFSHRDIVKMSQHQLILRTVEAFREVQVCKAYCANLCNVKPSRFRMENHFSNKIAKCTVNNIYLDIST